MKYSIKQNRLIYSIRNKLCYFIKIMRFQILAEIKFFSKMTEEFSYKTLDSALRRDKNAQRGNYQRQMCYFLKVIKNEMTNPIFQFFFF